MQISLLHPSQNNFRMYKKYIGWSYLIIPVPQNSFRMNKKYIESGYLRPLTHSPCLALLWYKLQASDDKKSGNSPCKKYLHQFYATASVHMYTVGTTK